MLAMTTERTLINEYQQRITEAADWWNINVAILEETKQLDEQRRFTERKAEAKEGFARAMNAAITILFDEEKVRTIRQAIFTIANDLRDKCVNFPKTDRGLAPYVDEENTRRLLWRKSKKSENSLPTFNTEESSSSSEEEQETADADEGTLTITPSPLTDLEVFENQFYEPRPYNVWNFKLDPRFGLRHPGNIPAGVVFNALYFFTSVGDLVIDPMAGGGVVGDCCKAVNRNCLMYDINPTRDDITKLDIGSGLPNECKNANLVFWDPPYWKKKEAQYDNPGSISSLSLKGYLEVFKEAAVDFDEKGIQKVALLMSDYLSYDNGKSIFIWDYVNIFVEVGWKPVSHIHCPLSTEQVHNHANLINERKLWGLSRSLVTFQR